MIVRGGYDSGCPGDCAATGSSASWISCIVDLFMHKMGPEARPRPVIAGQQGTAPTATCCDNFSSSPLQYVLRGPPICRPIPSDSCDWRILRHRAVSSTEQFQRASIRTILAVGTVQNSAAPATCCPRQSASPVHHSNPLIR